MEFRFQARTSNYYCCYYYYDKKGLVVFLFGPKLETIYGTPFVPTSLTIVEIAIAIIRTVMFLFVLLCYVLFCFVLFCFVFLLLNHFLI